MSNPHIPSNILREAENLVIGDRQTDYGHPADDFARSAAMMSQVLSKKLKVPIEPEDVPLLMIAVKLSRLVNGHKRDSLVDIAGYALTCQMVHDRKKDLHDEQK